MAATVRKVTVNLPEEVLERTMRITGKGITDTLLEGLAEIERRQRRGALRRLRGQIRLELDLGETRR